MYREEFERHGLSEVVTLTCRDVCADGFGLVCEADAGIWVYQMQNVGVVGTGMRVWQMQVCGCGQYK